MLSNAKIVRNMVYMQLFFCCVLKTLLLCSSQSRADLLTLGLAVTNILNGLVWLSIRPKAISAVRTCVVIMSDC